MRKKDHKGRVLVLALSVLALCSCYPPNQPMVRMAPDVKTSLVVFFKPATTYKEINHFDENVIGIPDEKGGHASLPGMVSVLSINKGEYKGEAIEFMANATDEQKSFVKQRVAASPIVYKIYENTAPDAIKDL